MEETRKTKKISICIPAYNRANLLSDLLDSIFCQEYDDFEIVIAEDLSPEQHEIRTISLDYAKRYPQKILYVENNINLGYDGNLRNLINLAKGEYVVFMGNDDLMCQGSLQVISNAIEAESNIGVLIRSYAVFKDTPSKIVQTFRYFENKRIFPAGGESIITAFRRSVMISGMTFHRETAQQYETTRFDGTLLYQLYLVAEIMTKSKGVFVPEILTLYRSGGIPDFGNSISERNKFKPREQTPASSVHFIQGILDIARFVEDKRGIKIYKGILLDLSNYSYPLLSIQSRQTFSVFNKYCWALMKKGLWRSPYFFVYWLALLILGVNRTDNLISLIKIRLGRTPLLGKVYKGLKE
jgi:glycosyltransferase involved in cell wall biosynthesis